MCGFEGTEMFFSMYNKKKLNCYGNVAVFLLFEIKLDMGQSVNMLSVTVVAVMGRVLTGSL